MKHERELLEETTMARTEWMNASTIQKNADADDVASKALKSIFAVAENYPNLKANQNFMMLQEELVGIENKIAYSRQPYDRTVLALNIAVQQFPTNNLARIIFSASAFCPLYLSSYLNVISGIKSSLKMLPVLI